MKQKEKTIKQWLNTLKEPYKSKAIQQTSEEVLTIRTDTLINSLYQMFVWKDSQEGDEYWRDLVISLENQ